MSSHFKLINDIPHYLALMRFEKPIGSLLLLWPTLWALWVASAGQPSSRYVWIFSLGVIVMRSAGCVINDYADRDIDANVERTQSRPLASGALTPSNALMLFCMLGAVAIGLLLLLPIRVWPWAIPAAALTIMYPFMKRFIQAPQLVLGLAFSFAIPMVYVAYDKAFDAVFWIMFIANVCWVVMFDTQYAMSDRQDDLKIGVKSTAIWFGRFDILIIAILQTVLVCGLMLIMVLLNLSHSFMLSVCIVAGMFMYQQWLIRERQAAPCFQAFINNGWVGAVVWFGLLTAF
ncbi:MAG: 4-hydroxybenzoate polyprenyltransferase [Arenicella sp.]|jgi:4-hydroxybenzoate polyprenyltransferase